MPLINTHSELISFLNKYLPKEIEGVICVTTMRKKTITSWVHSNGSGDVSVRWEVELVCEQNSIDEGTRLELMFAADKYIRLFGEWCDNITIDLTYIVK